MAITFTGHELTPAERELILDDQRCALESAHWQSGGHVCTDIAKCPMRHFDLPHDEVISRQILIGKLTMGDEQREEPRAVFGRPRRTGR